MSARPPHTGRTGAAASTLDPDRRPSVAADAEVPFPGPGTDPVHPSLRYRTLEVEVRAGGDPQRQARVLSAMVANSPVALLRLEVGEEVVHPLGATTLGARQNRVLVFGMRDRGAPFDRLATAEVLDLVRGTAHVLDARRLP